MINQQTRGSVILSPSSERRLNARQQIIWIVFGPMLLLVRSLARNYDGKTLPYISFCLLNLFFQRNLCVLVKEMWFMYDLHSLFSFVLDSQVPQSHVNVIFIPHTIHWARLVLFRGNKLIALLRGLSASWPQFPPTSQLFSAQVCNDISARVPTCSMIERLPKNAIVIHLHFSQRKHKMVRTYPETSHKHRIRQHTIKILHAMFLLMLLLVESKNMMICFLQWDFLSISVFDASDWSSFWK